MNCETNLVYENNTYLQEYIEEVKTGKKQACEKLKKQLAQLEELLSDDRVVFDTRLADIFIFFCENIYKQRRGRFRGKHLKLMLWQKAWATALLSFIKKDTGAFWFNICLLLISRKNGKSQICTALALFFLQWLKGEDLCIASCDEKTVQELYSEISLCAKQIDPDQKRIKSTIQKIKNLKNDCSVKRLTQNSENTGDSFNFSICIVDELHKLVDNEMVVNLEGCTASQVSPLTIYISTQGDIDNGALDMLMERCTRKLDEDDETEERLLAWIYEQDSELEVFTNEDSWGKSNPSLDEVIQRDYLRQQVDKIRKQKSERPRILNRHFNLKQSVNGSSWLDADDIEMIEKPLDLEKFRGCIAVAGADLSKTTDLCSLSLIIFKENDDKKYVWSHSFIPRAKLAKADDKEAGAEYIDWIHAGYITVHDGGEVNIFDVGNYLKQLRITYGLRIVYVAYDQRFSDDFKQSLQNFNLEVINQNTKSLSGAIKATEVDFQHGIFQYHDPVLNWALKNCRVKSNFDEVILTKEKKEQRIDPAAALVNAVEVYRRHKHDIDNAR